ncbi:Gfo/Idh/MocA family protein [Fictibacillus phosphorivorans]|uniref:Gfo/Idh/MocA family protein n=1 Tax=Fictibacillus phosphorivorans TaxID=1221500 RepID=UPI003CF3854A
MDNKIKIGVLGCSNIAWKSIIPAILGNKNFILKGVGSRSEEKGKIFAEKFQTNYYTYGDLINDSDIDAIYVSLPVSLHYVWGKKVITANKHLLMEKTFTHSYSSALDLLSLAEEKNLVAMEALMYIYHPLFKKVKELVDIGELGNLRSIEAMFGFPRLPDNDIRNNKELGGGALFDNLIYPLSLCLYLASDSNFSYNFKIFKDEKQDLDLRGSLVINFSTFSAYLSFGFDCMYRNEYCVWGSKGYLKVQRAFSRPIDMDADIHLVTHESERNLKIPSANHFSKMLDAFFSKIKRLDTTGKNERDDILTRLKIITDIYHKVGESEAK